MTALAVVLTVANLALTARIFHRHMTGQPPRLLDLHDRRSH